MTSSASSPSTPITVSGTAPNHRPSGANPSTRIGSPQKRRADIEAIPDSVLAGKAWAHPVALVIEQLALKQGPAIRSFDLAALGVGFEEPLNPFEGRAIHDGFVLTLEPFAAMVDFAEIDAVFEKVGEGTVGEGNAPVVFGHLGVALLGDDAHAIEFGHQLAERL